MSALKIAYENLQASNAPFEIEIDTAVKRVLASGWFINGQNVTDFEDNFATYIGAKYCIGVANGLDALTLSLRAMDYPKGSDIITSFIFRVRNTPSALYKALGGFATNNVNMTKLESYQPNGFLATQFYADIEGHPDSEPVRLALEELDFYCSKMDILGVYKAAPERAALKDA